MNSERIGPPLDVRELFASDRAKLIALLNELPVDQWKQPTVCPGWSVHDVVSHVVHDHLRRLSGTRDGHHPAWADSGEGLAAALSRANEEFVAAARGVSPRLLIDLLAHLGPQLDQLWSELNLASLGGDVSWVLPDQPAPVWLDVAREFTEFWVHQQQIRDAVAQPGAREPKVLGAVVDTLVRSLPRALAATSAGLGTAVTLTVEITQDIRITWTASKDDRGWRLERQTHPLPAAHIGMDADTFWRLTTRGLGPSDARSRSNLDGDSRLADAALQLISIIR